MLYGDIFERMIRDPRYLARLDWGTPRPGHPEGTIRAHIAELERNLEKLRSRLSPEDYWKLKLLIHVHDTFKPDSHEGVAIASPKSHASLAARFLAEYCADPDLVTIVQFHDEPFALYRQLQHRGAYNRDRLRHMLTAIQDWNLFLAFEIIDGCTAGKSRAPLKWFFQQVQGKVKSDFTEADIIS